jgi:glycogen phosphorylase
MPTWDSKEADEIWTEACGKDRWLGMNKTLEQDIRKVSDERLWEMRTNANKALIEFAREHFENNCLAPAIRPMPLNRQKICLIPTF